MTQDSHHHQSHPDIIKRLKRAQGHLLSVIRMIEAEQPCLDIAQQLHAVEKAIHQAKKVLVQDHIDHCFDSTVDGLPDAQRARLDEFKAITKYL
jgi:hypothetical protein NreA